VTAGKKGRGGWPALEDEISSLIVSQGGRKEENPEGGRDQGIACRSHWDEIGE